MKTTLTIELILKLDTWSRIEDLLDLCVCRRSTRPAIMSLGTMSKSLKNSAKRLATSEYASCREGAGIKVRGKHPEMFEPKVQDFCNKHQTQSKLFIVLLVVQQGCWDIFNLNTNIFPYAPCKIK